MNRRELLQRAATFGAAAAVAGVAGRLQAASGGNEKRGGGQPSSAATALHAPAHGMIPVAFLISDGAVVIDFAGPWEVFQDVMIPSRGSSMEDQMPFELYTVAEKKDAIRASNGLKIVPDYDFADAPAPKVLVIPAQSDATAATKDWIRKVAKNADVVMSVCTGAFVLASTGLLNGRAATTHHGNYYNFATQFPEVKVKRGARFVEDGNLASSGGLSSGIDLALRVVERYFGREVAEDTALNMEYQGEGWKDAQSNSRYAAAFVQRPGHPVCPVCGMDPDTSLKSVYKGRTYYFCSGAHKAQFEAAPEYFLNPATT